MMSGKSDQVKGRAKEAAGILSGNKDLEAEGKSDRRRGEAEEKIDNATSKVDELIDKAKGIVDDAAAKAEDTLDPKKFCRGRPVWEDVMIVIVGLILLVAASIVGVAGVLGNAGSGHDLAGGFSVLGYDVTGSTGTLFLYGIVVGAVAMLGLTMLLAGSHRTARRGRAARAELKQSRNETAMVRQDRDDLLHQRETDTADQESPARRSDAPNGDDKLSPGSESPPTGTPPS